MSDIIINLGDDPYNLAPALREVVRLTNSRERAARDDSVSLAWNSQTGALIMGWNKLSRCICEKYADNGDITAVIVQIKRLLAEAPDVMAYLARAYGLAKAEADDA